MSIRNRLLLSFGIVAAIFFLNAAFVVQKSSVIAEHSQRFVSDVWRTADGIMRARLGLNEIYRQVVEPSTGPVEQRVAAIRNQFAESRRLIENTALGEAERQGLLASLDQFADSMAAPIEQQALPGAKMESADALADPVLEKLREIADLQLVTEFNRAVMAFNDYLITHDQVEQEAFQSACGKIRESAQFGKFATEFASFEAAGRDVFVAAKSHGEAVARFRERALTLDASLQATQNTFTNTVLRPLGEQVRHVTGNIVFGTKSAGFATLLVTGFVTWLMVRQICRPLRATTRALEEIANGDGDLSRELPATRQDELGELARAFNQFVRRIRGTVEQIRDISGTVSQAADSLSHNAHELAAGVNQTTSQSTTIAAAAEEMSLNIGRMASNSEGIFKDVQLVNEAINQVTATIADVAKNSDHAAHVAGDAAALAAAGNECIGNLGEAASEIGRVIEVIQDIAEQTNLLALNATIEAARAGEAGKGFAVVATEVKELARQTATATDDIRQRIEAIQSTATRAVQSIEGITKVIQQVKEVSCAIASAVEEQSVMARDISEKISHTSCAIGTVANGISESATATRDITQNLTGMDEVIGQTSTTANSTQTSSVQLAELAGNLQALVAQFRTQAKDATGALSA